MKVKASCGKFCLACWGTWPIKSNIFPKIYLHKNGFSTNFYNIRENLYFRDKPFTFVLAQVPTLLSVNATAPPFSSCKYNIKCSTPASSIGSSLSRVSSSSPSSTPTDSESHGPGGVGQVHLSSSHSQAYSLGPLSSHHNSASGEHDSDELGGLSSGGSISGNGIPPPIASRPERTKSIVSIICLALIPIYYLFNSFPK